MKTPASQASGSQESGSQAPASSQESGSQTPASSQESSSQESGSQESGSQAPASSQESGSQAPASQEPVSQAPANKELGSQAPASQELTIQAPASRRLATGALSANLSIAPASMRIAPESFSLDSVATDTTNDAATDGQYQTLTPDQSMTVGKTDGSSVTLSGSQVLDHFTNTVENFNSKGEDDYPEKNKTPQAADANGVWQLTSQSTHDYTGTYTMHGITGPQVAHVSFENDIDFDHNFTMTGALGIGTKTSGGADGVGIVFAPGDPEYATTGKTGGNLGLGGLNNAFAFVYDDFHNSGDDTSGVTDPGTGAYFGWRSTDANGVIQKVAANSNDWKAASTFDLSNRATNPLIDFKMNYDSGTHVLTIIIQNKTFTRDLTGIDTSKGYSISIAASTGDNKNDYSARIDSFTYTPKTAKVSVTVADATAGDTQVSTTTPVTANIGDTIYVFSTKAAAERAVAADPTLDPKLVTVIPASTTNSVYVVDGDQAATSNGTVHYINDDSSIADGAYYSYTVTGDASQALTVPISQAFKANVTPVDSVTGEPIPGVDPIQVTTVAGKSVVIQIPGYTPATVALAAPKDGETVGNYTVQVNTGTPVDATTTPTTSDVANPIAHYYTATGTTIDGKTVNATVTVGTNQSITDVLNGQLATDGATAGITGDDYYWSTVPNAADTDSTDKSNPQDSTSILVPTKSTLDKWIQQADDNQTQANDEKTAAQDIYDKFVASPDITDDQKAAAKSLLDSVNAVYDKLSKTNSDAKALLEAAESSTDPATIVKDSQAGYAGISGMDTSLADFKKDVDNMATTNAATQASMVTFKSWSQVYGTELEKPKADFGTGFGVTVSDADLAGLFADSGNFYYVNALDLDTAVTPKDVGAYYFKLTDAGRSYLKSLTPDNPNAGLYVSAMVTITPAAAAPTIQDATVDYGGDKGELPEIIGSLGTKVTGADDVLTQGDYEVVDTDGNVVPVDKLQAGGDYTIRYTAAAQAALKADSNYTFGDFGTAKLTVTPLDITVVAQNTGKTYGADEPKLTLTDASKAGLVNGDQLSDLGVTLTRDTSKEDVGEYAGNITGSVSGANKNYTVKVTAGDFTITPAAAAPTIQDATVDYGGDKGELPEIIGSLGTKVTGADDVLTQGDYEVVDTDGNVVPVDKLQAGGDYTIRYTAAAQADLKADSNYTFGDFGTAKLTVTPLDITVVAQSAGKTYGADEPALTLTDDSKAGLVNGDQLSDLDVTLTRDTSRENVGEYAGNITGSASGSNTNYTVKVTAGDFTITKASANVKVANVISTYGDLPKLSATVSVPNNAITLSDFEIVNADGDMVALDKLQAGDYTIQLTQAAKTGLAQENSNYDFTNPDHTSSFGTGTLTVNPRAVTIQIANQQTYAGMTNPENVAALTSDSGAFKDGEGVTDLNLTYSEPTNPAVGSYTIDATNGNTNYDVTVLPGQLTVLGKEKDAAGTTTITEKDAAGNVVKIDKQWPDGSHTTYTYDPATDKRTVSEQKDGKQVDQQELTSDSSKVTLSDDTNTSTTVTLDPTTKQPVFEHDTTQTAGDTTTTKDADGNVVKVVKQWPDGNQTTYTYDPISGDRAVTEEKDGKPVDQQKITSDDAKTTLSSGDDVKTIVNTGKPGSQPTFEHDTTQTATDDAGNVTATTKDDAGNVIDVTKQWTDGSTTTYTYDPATKTQNVTEQKDGKTVDQKTITPDAPKATLSTGNGVETIVNAPKPGAEPTFDHETTKTDGDTTTTKDADGNVVKVVKQWPDDSQTTYTYDPASGDRTVTEQKDGKTDEQPIAKDTNKATVSAVDGAKTIVNAGQPGSQPTFEHDTTQTTTDKAGNVTATTKDDAGNVIDVTKQWTDGSTTKYTYDPATKTQTVTEQKDGKTVDQKTITPDAPKATLSTGNGVETTVNAPKPGAEPTFDHETTKTDGDTTTTKDANGNVVKVVKQWPDDSQTTYTYDPITGDRAVTEQKDGKPVDQQKITSDDEKTTLSSGDDVKTIVNTGKPGSQPTFEHDTTHTATDKYGNTTATTKDTDGNVVKVVKQWTDGSQTTYTFDPATGKQTVTEQKDGKTVDQKTITPDKPKATLASGDGAETIVNTGKPGAEPTFEHDTTQTTTDKSGNVTTTTKDADGNVVKITKQWIDGSKTIYTSDPKTGKQTVIEQKDGKTVDEKTITPDAKATLASGDGAETIVTAGQPGTEPTFEHDATKTTTTTDKAGNVTTTTKDADGNVIKVTEQWTDGSVTTYTYDPVTGKRVVTEQRDGKVVDQQTIDPDATKATLSSGAGVETIVNAGQPGSQPTFEHETIKTTTDKSGNVTATTTDANGNAVKVTKQWTDGSKTTYTYDPATGKRTVTEQRDGKTVDQQTIDPNASEVTLVDGAGGKVIVNFGKAGAEPSFTRQLAATGRRQVTVQKADDNQGKRASKQAKPVVQGKKSAQSATTNEVAGDVAVTGRVQAQPKAKSNQKQTELPQTGQKNESLLAEVGVVLLALLAVPFIRRRSH